MQCNVLLATCHKRTTVSCADVQKIPQHRATHTKSAGRGYARYDCRAVLVVSSSNTNSEILHLPSVLVCSVALTSSVVGAGGVRLTDGVEPFRVDLPSP